MSSAFKTVVAVAILALSSMALADQVLKPGESVIAKDKEKIACIAIDNKDNKPTPTPTPTPTPVQNAVVKPVIFQAQGSAFMSADEIADPNSCSSKSMIQDAMEQARAHAASNGFAQCKNAGYAICTIVESAEITYIPNGSRCYAYIQIKASN